MLHLHRIGEIPLDEGTLGVLALPGGERLFTLELPWRDNEPRISCVPAGEYRLEPHSSGRHKNTWALVGDTVSHCAEVGKRRCGILFDQANWAHELQGCIAVGVSVGELLGKVALVNSAVAMTKLRRAIRATDDLRILITGGSG